jgi:hypothetical protein
MAKTFTITLSDAEEKALATVAVSPLQWIQNAASERSRLAMEEIVSAEIQRKLGAGETISGTKEEIVLAANVKSAAQVQEEYEASRG